MTAAPRASPASNPAVTPRRAPSVVKSAALRAMTSAGIERLFRPFSRRSAVVYMLHRFTPVSPLTDRYEPETMRALLAYLRQREYALVDLPTLFESLNGDREPLRHAVAFTIDDGYADQATIGGPVFAEFDCPVTTFVTTGFLDGHLWFWWDQIEYTFANAARPSVRFEWDRAEVVYALRSPADVSAASEDFTERCKALPDAEKHGVIARLAAAAEVALPAAAPAGYEPMTWDQLRACERAGMTFAPHTVTHPILARSGDDQAAREIRESWRRLREEAAHPVPIFAYPNGMPDDFGPREFETLRAVGLQGAVTSVAGFATPRRFRERNGAFLVPRLPFPDSLPYLIQQVSGIERLKFMLRGAR